MRKQSITRATSSNRGNPMANPMTPRIYTTEDIRAMRRKLPCGAPAWNDDMVIAYVTTYYDLVSAGRELRGDQQERSFCQA